jgi:hypothetical protein
MAYNGYSETATDCSNYLFLCKVKNKLKISLHARKTTVWLRFGNKTIENSKFLENVTKKITNVYIYHYMLFATINKRDKYFKCLELKAVLANSDTFLLLATVQKVNGQMTHVRSLTG